MAAPNVVFVFGDQWREQATGFAGDPNVRTPYLDGLAAESCRLVNATSGCPICTPYRGSLLTGQYPLTTGLFTNDVPLGTEAVGFGTAFKQAGYDTAYVGKWHVNAGGRTSYIPPERRQGFDYWRVLECTHDYWNSPYYADDERETRVWEGYDAAAQTREAQRYIRAHDPARPFCLVLSWGPPHNPYHTAPEEYLALYDPETLTLRPNVPVEREAEARQNLVGYYAHITALDALLGELDATLHDCGLAEGTIFVFTSDHGDMVGSQQWKTNKQCPYDESVRVPFLLRWPERFGQQARTINTPIDAPDILPTLLDLCGLPIPATAEGRSLVPALNGQDDPTDADGVLIAGYAPMADWSKLNRGGREYRGLRTTRYTYVRDLQGPWLLFDNQEDPYQLTNLVNRPESQAIQERLDAVLQDKLRQRSDTFEENTALLERWGYPYNETGTVPYW